MSGSNFKLEQVGKFVQGRRKWVSSNVGEQGVQFPTQFLANQKCRNSRSYKFMVPHHDSKGFLRH